MTDTFFLETAIALARGIAPDVLEAERQRYNDEERAEQRHREEPARTELETSRPR